MLDIKQFFKKHSFYKETKRINTEPFRSYYVPFSSKQDFSYKEGIIDREKSDRYISLDGEWLFKPYSSLGEIESIEQELPDKILVPSCVQLFGYDSNAYINFVYPFPFNPPFVPEENPTFHYQRHFKIDSHESLYLCFEGVDSAFYVFINKKFVGYSQITHSLSEFEITDYVQKGDNVIDVVVLKWCASSYLEDQDKFRFTGIIRSVYLLDRPKKHITDFKIIPSYKDEKGFVEVRNLSAIPFEVHFNKQNKVIEPNESFTFEIDKPHIWSVEDPYLYDLVISSNDEKIMQKVGIRNVYIEDGIFKINDKHIKLKGVNRHEFTPERGAAITFEDTLKDLKMIKELGINAIRTSHYPDMPEFYDLCDYLGLYILDEADVESHGAVSSEGGYLREVWQKFANNGIYDGAIFDREQSLYERDKNHSCIIMWSLGNESSYGKMFYRGADYIKEHDERPIHYEGIFQIVDKSEYYTDRLDVMSRMYPEISWMANDYLNDPLEKRPLVLCEYSHSMGNSCGDLASYWRLIMSNDRFIGAFVWEWNDHAIRGDKGYLYGGDFGEKHVDGNYCCDGLVTPDRTCKSNTRELKAVYAGKLYPDKEVSLCKTLEKLSCDKPLKVTFDDEHASIKEVVVNDKNILKSPITFNCVRAFLDNDIPDKYKMQKIIDGGIYVKEKRIEEMSVIYYCVCKDVEGVECIDFTIRYSVYNTCIDIELSYKIKDGINYLPRIGVEFALDNKDKELVFFGYGPDESYIDKRIHNSIGEFKVNVDDNYYHYIKPQESGSHYYSSYFEIGGIRVTAEKPFSFNVIPYSKEDLLNNKHDFELPKSNRNFVSIDVDMAGVGSHSCGPELLDEFRIPKSDTNHFRIEFVSLNTKY